MAAWADIEPPVRAAAATSPSPTSSSTLGSCGGGGGSSRGDLCPQVGPPHLHRASSSAACSNSGRQSSSGRRGAPSGRRGSEDGRDGGILGAAAVPRCGGILSATAPLARGRQLPEQMREGDALAAGVSIVFQHCYRLSPCCREALLETVLDSSKCRPLLVCEVKLMRSEFVQNLVLIMLKLQGTSDFYHFTSYFISISGSTFKVADAPQHQDLVF